MTGAHLAAQFAEIGIGQLAATAPGAATIAFAIAAALALLLVTLRWQLGRRRSTVPLPPLPPDHIEGCGPGRNMLAYPSLACPACDQIAEQLDDGGTPGGCPWCTPGNGCIDSTLCTCAERCERGYCKAGGNRA